MTNDERAPLAGSSFVIRHSSFVIRHSSFVIPHFPAPRAQRIFPLPMKPRLLPLLCCLALPLYAQEPEPMPRPVPPPGVAVPDDVRAELSAGVAKLGQEIAALRTQLAQKPQAALLPDVEIFHK